jgi:hypothetical protein
VELIARHRRAALAALHFKACDIDISRMIESSDRSPPLSSSDSLTFKVFATHCLATSVPAVWIRCEGATSPSAPCTPASVGCVTRERRKCGPRTDGSGSTRHALIAGLEMSTKRWIGPTR